MIHIFSLDREKVILTAIGVHECEEKRLKNEESQEFLASQEIFEG